jgi:hypothetical protein
MDDPKPQAKEFHEGPEAARRFDALVRKVITVPHSEIQKRHEEWSKMKKRQRKKAQ